MSTNVAFMIDQVSQELLDLQEKERAFKETLDSVSSLTDKKKVLWLDIFRNAYREIEIAYTLLGQATATNTNGDTESGVFHSEVGPVLVKYLERANKGNEQLIKLANMLEVEQEKSEADKLDNFRNQRSKISSGLA